MDTLQTIENSLQDLLSSSIKLLPALLSAIVILLLTRYAAGVVRQLSTQLGQRTIRSRSLQLLLSKTSYVAAWAIGILTASIVAFPGLRLGDVIATLGLSSVAIGFAFQDIFKNFLAGILLLVQEPFRIGDQIVVGNYEGTVERIDIRTTKIRTYTGERVLLPNSEVFTSAVQVRTAFDTRRTDLAVGVDYNTSLPEATAVLKRTISEVVGVRSEPAPEIDLVSFGDSSIDLIVRYWTAPEQQEVRRVQTRAIMAIKKAFDRAEICIPYPIRTLYFYNQQHYNDYLPTKNNSKDMISGLQRS
ncbi:MAG TPA: mechanosensitive ion channel family protein [Oscillatoriales cyanobacterium M59_W2019_021]|nr:MAG: mechanosensitive ion channel family protein [Cyanobacteria bacterium J055]HIK33701.1 mechanosensitive ion channel family protein [Oscillatoriales cyanobacterium M4454_W2019_049]HIK53119.1 mechanosensitive ion channel family protein [Oscillatoriales cyanobacterium M59_W2019_021]